MIALRGEAVSLLGNRVLNSMKRIFSIVATVLLTGLVFGDLACAQEHEASETGHEHHEHTFGVFTGFATEGKRESGPALGLEYEYRLSSSFGVGGVAEYTFGDLDTLVLAMPFAYHGGPWKFYVGPGLERVEGNNEFLVRIGGEYGFHRGDWEISPQIDIDFVDGEQVFILGVTFLRGF